MLSMMFMVDDGKIERQGTDACISHRSRGQVEE